MDGAELLGERRGERRVLASVYECTCSGGWRWAGSVTRECLGCLASRVELLGVYLSLRLCL